MARRRLTAIAGALGLVAWLVSSGVTAQADTPPGPDLTYYSLLATYSWSSHDVCFANSGTADNTTVAGTCTITQPTPTGKRNIAVCVQSNYGAAPTQTCSISQTNGSYNNYALVIQRFQQSQGPNQDANQTASIQQTTTGSGSNFGGVFQTIIQSIGQEDDPIQTNTQHVEVAPFTGPGLKQVSGTGSNFAAVVQFSAQSASGGFAQTQTADQFAGDSGSFPGDGIDQTAPSGSNAAFLSHIQKQQLDKSASQTQTATQDGDITQSGLVSKNFASGNQFQDQQEHGLPNAVQQQTGDPKCCSAQNGGQFFINQTTNQLADHIAPLRQRENIEGNCDSAPNGCHVRQSATQNGVTTPNSCTGSSCHPTIACSFSESSVPGCVTTPGTPLLLSSRP